MKKCNTLCPQHGAERQKDAQLLGTSIMYSQLQHLLLMYVN